LLYIPHVAKGMVIKAGRYISPPDIEAQLAPDNYLYTHSLMFTVDCYTQTGVSAAIKFNDQGTVLFGIHAGDDIAPWNAAAHPTGMAMVRWVRPDWQNENDDAGVLKIVMTGSATDGPEWQQHIRDKRRREGLGKRFKAPIDPFKIVIVRDMWLTGFDVPSLHTMYVDKPMRGMG
jgi:hypothetical protein